MITVGTVPTHPPHRSPAAKSDAPPPYTHSQKVLSKPPCTCPRREGGGTPANAANTANDETDGSDAAARVAKIAAGVALIGVATPILAVGAAAVALPAIGFASTGVVGGT